MIFSDTSETVLQLQNSTDNTSVINAIDSMPYLEGSTETAAAIDYVITNSFKPEVGGRAGADDILIIITDGRSNDKNVTLAAAQRLGQTGIKTLAIGVSGAVDTEELHAMASDDRYVFNVSTYQALSTLQLELTQTACKGKIRHFLVICSVAYGIYHILRYSEINVDVLVVSLWSVNYVFV